MKRILVSASALALTAGSVSAAGLDRSGQSVLSVFDADNTAALSFGYVEPSVTGEDAGGNDYDVGESFTQTGLTYTNRVNEQISYSVILDQPYGVNVDYNNSPLTSSLGGTSADLNSDAITFVGRYRINDRFSVFGGIKAQRVSADVALNGQAYAGAISTAAVASQVPGLDAATLGAAALGDPAAQSSIVNRYGAATLNALGTQLPAQIQSFNANGGYDFEMEDDYSLGYVIGAAYEIPDIALRFAATYSFETEHKADTTENLFGMEFESDVEYVTPQSLNLDFQTGIAPGTLLLASYRWAEYSAVDVVPTMLNSDLVNLEDSHRFTLGLGRQFNEQFAGSISLLFEPETGDDTVSPLGPTDGLFGVTIGGNYVNGPMKFSGGINYSKLGDADAGIGGNSVAEFRDNSSVGIGFRAEMTF